MFLNSLFLSLSHLFNAKALWNEKKHDAAELGVNTILYSLYTILYTIFSMNIERCLHAHLRTHHELSDSASHPPVPLRTAPTPPTSTSSHWLGRGEVPGFAVFPEGEMGFQKHHPRIPDAPTDVCMLLPFGQWIWLLLICDLYPAQSSAQLGMGSGRREGEREHSYYHAIEPKGPRGKQRNGVVLQCSNCLL